MSDPYRDDYSEFHSDVGWLVQCAQTLSEQQTHRSDWATIAHFYPPLMGTPPNSGPSHLPLKVTEVQIMAPDATAVPLTTPIFVLNNEQLEQVVAGPSARAYLFQGDRLIDLGGFCITPQRSSRTASSSNDPTNQQAVTLTPHDTLIHRP